ncbi:MAG: cupredoxin domain-containing protein [Methylocella sp.]
MRNLTKRQRSRAWCRGLCLVVATTAFGVILTLPAVAAGTEVDIDNFAFTPKELTVKAGTAIVFRNRDDIPHLVVGAKGEFHSKALDTDDTFEFAFAKAGTYSYYCGLHPQMQGRIVVTP